MSTTHIPTTSITFDCPKRRTAHWRRPALVSFAVILLGLVSMTSEANPVSNPASIPLPISGTIDEKGIPVGWDLEIYENHHEIKLEPFKNGRFAIRLASNESSFGLHKVVEVDLKEFPILTWWWKVDRLPEAGAPAQRKPMTRPPKST